MIKQYIPYACQSIDQTDIERVTEILHSDFLTQGPAVPSFEQSLSEYVGSKYASAVSSATAALHLSCLALGLSNGDWLWTSPITYVASANCGLYCGANIDFVDIEPKTYNLSADALEDKLVLAEKIGKLPKIVIPVHFAGQSCDMKKIKKLSDKYNFSIIEDASHAIGGRYLGQPIGSCKYSDITVFSFHPVKIVTTAEGGAVLTNDEGINEKVQQLRSHGITRNQDVLINYEGPWSYEQHHLGYNYRMSDIHAALGSSQLERIDQFVKARHKIAAQYNDILSELPIQCPYQHDDSFSAFHLYPIQVEKKHRKKLFMQLRELGIGVNVHYIPVYKQPYYQKLGFSDCYCYHSEAYYGRAISLPIYPGLSNENQQVVEEQIGVFFDS